MLNAQTFTTIVPVLNACPGVSSYQEHVLFVGYKLAGVAPAHLSPGFVFGYNEEARAATEDGLAEIWDTAASAAAEFVK